jgi:hypothetical protein
LLEVSVFNKSYYRMFKPKLLILGVIFAIEAYEGAIPKMERQIELTQRAEELEFSVLWFRDVPFYDSEFTKVSLNTL